jgi:outer membrane biosynthesis protein TonB
MRKLLVIFYIFVTLPLFAQEVRTARVIKKAESAEKPSATPTPAPRRSIIDRFFTKEKPTPTPTPKVSATPTPKPKQAKVAKPKPKQPAKPAEEAETEAPKPAEPAAEKPVAVEGKPEEKPADKPAETAKPAKGGKTKPAAVPAKPEKPDFSGLDDAAKYKAVKDLALKEQVIIDLKAKADTTIDAEDAKQATLAYNRALFRKIREIEPSLDAYVDKLEQAVLKRVK